MAKCADCGFLYVRNRSTGQPDKANDVVRNVNTRAIGDIPACFACVTVLATELGEGEDAFSQVVHKERPCQSAYPWRPGFSAKEHARMKYEDDLRKDSERRDSELRTWMAEQERANKAAEREWQERQEERDWRRQKRQKVMGGFWSLFVALASAGTTYWLTTSAQHSSPHIPPASSAAPAPPNAEAPKPVPTIPPATP